MALTMALSGESVTALLAPEAPLLVMPKHVAEIAPNAVFVNARSTAPVEIRLSAGAGLALPNGWTLGANDAGSALVPPASPTPGLH